MGTEPAEPVPRPEPSSPPNGLSSFPNDGASSGSLIWFYDSCGSEALDAASCIFLEQGRRGVKTRSDPEEGELTLARTKIGELRGEKLIQSRRIILQSLLRDFSVSSAYVSPRPHVPSPWSPSVGWMSFGPRFPGL
jgi:hypothetical protein